MSTISAILNVFFTAVVPALLTFGGFVAVIVGVNVLIKFVLNGIGFIEGISVHGYKEARRAYNGVQRDVKFRQQPMSDKVSILKGYILLFGIFYILSMFGALWVLLGLIGYAVYMVHKLSKGESHNKTISAAERVNAAFRQVRRMTDTGRYVKYTFKCFKEGKDALNPEEFKKQEYYRLQDESYNTIKTKEMKKNSRVREKSRAKSDGSGVKGVISSIFNRFKGVKDEDYIDQMVQTNEEVRKSRGFVEKPPNTNITGSNFEDFWVAEAVTPDKSNTKSQGNYYEIPEFGDGFEEDTEHITNLQKIVSAEVFNSAPDFEDIGEWEDKEELKSGSPLLQYNIPNVFSDPKNGSYSQVRPGKADISGTQGAVFQLPAQNPSVSQPMADDCEIIDGVVEPDWIAGANDNDGEDIFSAEWSKSDETDGVSTDNSSVGGSSSSFDSDKTFKLQASQISNTNDYVNMEELINSDVNAPSFGKASDIEVEYEPTIITANKFNINFDSDSGHSQLRRRNDNTDTSITFTKGVVTSLSYVLMPGGEGLKINPKDKSYADMICSDGNAGLIYEDMKRFEFYLDDAVTSPITMELMSVESISPSVQFKFVYMNSYYTLSNSDKPSWCGNIIDESHPLFSFNVAGNNGATLPVSFVQTPDQNRLVFTDKCKVEAYKNGLLIQSPGIVDIVTKFIQKSNFSITRDGLYMGILDIEPHSMSLVCKDYQGEIWWHAMSTEDLGTWFKVNNVVNISSGSHVEHVTGSPSVEVGTAPSFDDNIYKTRVKPDNALSSQLDILDDALKDVELKDFEDIIGTTEPSDELVPVKPLFTLDLKTCGVKLSYWLSDERHGVNADMSVISECIQRNIMSQVIREVESLLPKQIKLEDNCTAYLSYGYKGLFSLMLTENEFDFDNYNKIIVDEYNFPSIFGRSSNTANSKFSTDIYVSDESYEATMPYTYTQQSCSELLLKDNKYLIIEDKEKIVNSAANLGINIAEYLKLEILDIAGYSTIEGSKLYIIEWHEFEWKLAIQQRGKYYSVGIYREILPSLFN